ncbi:AMP-binding protein [Sphingobacterium sp. ML3W]|uniref:AMP-binding protein n=1 Tax=Sphingobacterium sp. ML3W TaxID=1538644 RepID=UPI003FA7077A
MILGELNAVLSEKGITHLDTVPSLLMLLDPRSYKTLKRVVSGGEPCPARLKEWEEYCLFYNSYGPTETTVTSTMQLLNGASNIVYDRSTFA